MTTRYVTEHHPDAEGRWALCADGAIVDTFDRREEAVRALVHADGDRWSTLVAAAGDLIPWESAPAIAFVGQATSDRRFLEPGGGFRAFPLPLMAQVATNWGHDGAIIAGRIDSAEVVGSEVRAAGVLDGGEFASEVARFVGQHMLDRVSIDLAEYDVETEILEYDDDGWVTDWLDHFTDWVIAGATLVNISAFADARIRLTSDVAEAAADETDEPSDDAETAAGLLRRPLHLVAAGGPAQPPVDWFADPELDEPTPLTVTADGRVFGHIAAWDTCHIGHPGTCITPPRSRASYGFFTTGAVLCEEGCQVPTGVLSFGGGHADTRLNAAAAAAHYDDSTTAAADVAAGEDEHGIWVAGAMRPGLTDEQVREFRAASPSGDWRRINGELELVACLAVNVPGFPIPRTRVASGQVQTLVAALAPRAAGTLAGRTPASLAERVDRLERLLAPNALANVRQRVRT